MPFRDTFYRPSVPSGLRGLAPNASARGALGRNDESAQRPNDRAHNVDSFDSRNFTFRNILIYLSVNESRFFVTRFSFLVGDQINSAMRTTFARRIKRNTASISMRDY